MNVIYFKKAVKQEKLSLVTLSPTNEEVYADFFFFLKNFNWRLITLQYCDGFHHTFT